MSSESIISTAAFNRWNNHHIMNMSPPPPPSPENPTSSTLLHESLLPTTNSMTSEHYKCGLSTLLPMSCRGRAEAFARRLQSRLRSLSGQDEDSDSSTSGETTWLTPGTSDPNNLTLSSQPVRSCAVPDPPSTHLRWDSRFPHPTARPVHNTKPLPLSNHETDTKKGCNGLRADDNPSLAEDNVSLQSSSSHEGSSSYQDISTTSQSSSNQGPADLTPPDNNNTTTSFQEIRNSCSENTLSSSYSLACAEETEQVANNLINTLDILSRALTGNKTSSPNSHPVEEAEEETENNSNEAVQEGDEELIQSTEHILDESVEQVNETEDVLTNEAEAEAIPRIRRSSSLKTGKTPPGTPCPKKIVRFADVLGLDLADVRTFLDDVPKVPTSAYQDLADVDDMPNDSVQEWCNASKFHGIKVDRLLVPLFQQPGGQTDFLDRVREGLVCLENAFVEDPLVMSITGTVRVRNLDFHKSVYIRYSLNSWKSYADVQAKYVENSCDGFSDKFKFLLFVHTLKVGQRIEFAVRFHCRGSQYWDSNRGANYSFQCMPPANTVSTHSPATVSCSSDSWSASFYWYVIYYYIFLLYKVLFITYILQIRGILPPDDFGPRKMSHF